MVFYGYLAMSLLRLIQHVRMLNIMLAVLYTKYLVNSWRLALLLQTSPSHIKHLHCSFAHLTAYLPAVAMLGYERDPIKGVKAVFVDERAVNPSLVAALKADKHLVVCTLNAGVVRNDDADR